MWYLACTAGMYAAGAGCSAERWLRLSAALAALLQLAEPDAACCLLPAQLCSSSVLARASPWRA